MGTGAANDLHLTSLSLACQGRAGMDGRRKKLEIWKNGTKKKEEKKRPRETTTVRNPLRERLTFCHPDFIVRFKSIHISPFSWLNSSG